MNEKKSKPDDSNEKYTAQIVVETPRGSRNKYKLDPSTGRIKLSKVMPEGMVFPYDFGFFPGTAAQDGDPLDALVLGDEPTFPGCQIDCRLAGVLLGEQKEKGKTNRNDRILAVAEASVLYSEIRDSRELPAAVLKQIEDFFVNYQKVRQIEFRVLGHDGPEEAQRLLQDSEASFSQGKSKQPHRHEARRA